MRTVLLAEEVKFRSCQIAVLLLELLRKKLVNMLLIIFGILSDNI